MKKLTHAYSIALLLLTLLSACQDEWVKERPAYTGATLTAHFALSPVSLTECPLLDNATSPLTRTTAEDGLIAWEKTIKNIVVAQFAGTEGGAVLTGTPTYVSDYQSETFDATLVASGESSHTVLFIANTGNITAKITSGMTLAQAYALLHDVPTMLSDVNADGLPMTGKWQGVITTDNLLHNGQIVNIPMERIMAKVVLTVRSEVSGLEVNEVRVNNVPAKVALYTPAEQSDYIMYTVEKFETNDPRYIWFMPENTSTAKKTQIDIYASKEGKNYVYTTWLNVNGGDDYTVKRNTQYNLTTTIRKLTDAVTSRELEFDCHGEVYQLNLRTFLNGKVVDYYPNATQRGAAFALNESASDDVTGSYSEKDQCGWIQLFSVKDTWGTPWEGTYTYYAVFNSSTYQGYNAHVYVNENLSTEPRFAKIRLRYDEYRTKPPGSGSIPQTGNFILTIKQNGCLFNGPFGAYNSGTGSYDKDLVTNYTDHPSLVTWDVAQTICATKFYDVAKINWYLPTQSQLAGMWITNYDSKDALQGEYWSATADADNGANAWSMDYTTGTMTSVAKTATKKVRCVRDLD